MTRKEKKQLALAYHEAGHAVACYWFKLPFKAVTIEPFISGEKKGSLGMLLPGANWIAHGSETFPHLLRDLAGFVAQTRFQGKLSPHLHIQRLYKTTDAKKVLKWIRRFLPDNNCLPSDEKLTKAEKMAFLKWVLMRTEKLLMRKDPWNCIKAVAKELNEEYTLTELEVKKICEEVLKK